MGKYGDAAINAVKIVVSGNVKSPKAAWEKATCEIFGRGTSSQCKGCPKGAFLGLCEDGLIKGIPSGSYSRSEKNKKYALKAVHLLNQNSSLKFDEMELWTRVLNGEEKKYNQQMDVVISLWNNNLIDFSP